MMKCRIPLSAMLALAIRGVLSADPVCADDPLAWPAIGREQKPWAYNWWLGSAVDRENLAKEFERYRAGGLGGVHIIPIYGAKGAQDRYRTFLSPAWFEALDAAVDEAGKRDLGVDMTTGTGWCFGGPTISVEQSGMGLTTIAQPFPASGCIDKRQLKKDHRWLSLAAVGPAGEREDIATHIDAVGNISWKPPAAGWRIVGVATWPTNIKVKRAAPGGEGFMINPFYGQAMSAHLSAFTAPFAAYRGGKPRAMYHDSYEYANAAWSPDMAGEFSRRRGYDLAGRYDALAGYGDADTVARVWHDYRLTVSELMVDQVFSQWTTWCRERGFITRNQAHGSPGNLLDLYALADIPETEMFGHGGPDPLVSRFDEQIGKADRDVVCSKFASSAAHVMGRRLCAAETGTWLAEHFHESYEELKCLCDRMFAAGVNHVFWTGTVYSPDDAAWPGWLFYASTQLNPRNPLWREAPTINGYVARVQSVMQSGFIDHDILLYWPLESQWQNPKPGVNMMTVHSRGWIPPLARTLWERGWQYDLVSDRQIANLRTAGKGLVSQGGTTYQTVMVPSASIMPETTLAALLQCAEQGATVCFATPLPGDVPGLGRLQERRAVFRNLRARLGDGAADVLRTVTLGRGRIIIGPAEPALAAAGIARETLMDQTGVLVERRRHDLGRSYFIANQSMQPITGWAALATPAAAAVAMDPLTGRTGLLDIKAAGTGCSARLEILPGHSLIVRTMTRAIVGPAFDPLIPGDSVATLAGPWQVTFVAGGPTLPQPWTATTLASWTTHGDSATEAFSGSACYRITFDLPAGDAPLLLDLGEVRQVCRIRLNGRELGSLIMHPYRIALPAPVLKATGNALEIEVSNLAANRIRDLDRHKVPWRIFNDINMVDISYKGFNATTWPVEASGLLGPVALRTIRNARAQPESVR